MAARGFVEKKVRWMVQERRDEEIGKERNGDRSDSIVDGKRVDAE